MWPSWIPLGQEYMLLFSWDKLQSHMVTLGIGGAGDWEQYAVSQGGPLIQHFLEQLGDKKQIKADLPTACTQHIHKTQNT